MKLTILVVVFVSLWFAGLYILKDLDSVLLEEPLLPDVYMEDAKPRKIIVVVRHGETKYIHGNNVEGFFFFFFLLLSWASCLFFCGRF